MTRQALVRLALGLWPVAFAPYALSAPAQVVIIRHAEKPEGSGKDNELSERGRERARALVGFFETDPRVLQYGPPVAIYATEPQDEEGSVRAIQTVIPLALELRLKVQADYKRKQLGKLVKDILKNPAYEGRTVLVCWVHRFIPGLVEEFGYDAAPRRWPEEDFDTVWQLQFIGDRVVGFHAISEGVLPGTPAR